MAEIAKCVLVKPTGEFEAIEIKLVDHIFQIDIFGGDNEHHVGAYWARDKLKHNEKLYELHKQLGIICHDSGFLKGFKVNKYASAISGIELFGDIVFYVEKSDYEDEEAITEFPELDPQDLKLMFMINGQQFDSYTSSSFSSHHNVTVGI